MMSSSSSSSSDILGELEVSRNAFRKAEEEFYCEDQKLNILFYESLSGGELFEMREKFNTDWFIYYNPNPEMPYGQSYDYDGKLKGPFEGTEHYSKVDKWGLTSDVDGAAELFEGGKHLMFVSVIWILNPRLSSRGSHIISFRHYTHKVPMATWLIGEKLIEAAIAPEAFRLVELLTSSS